MNDFLMPFLFIFLAELGDKSMLLALAFASKYSFKTVVAGLFCATAVNHLLVVLFGANLVKFLPLDTISILCALAFVFFGIWTLRGDTLEEDDLKVMKKTPFWTVAIAFFFSEMGDKTQLATLTLAAQYQNTLFVWLGSTLGMVAGDTLGIAAGMLLGNKIPEKAIQLICGSIFIFVGVYGLYELLPEFEGKVVSAFILSGLAFLLGTFNKAQLAKCVKIK